MKVNIERFTHQSIPVLSYTPPNADKLIFINHGIYGSKEIIMQLIGMPLTKIGYKVVAIDAYMHGDRVQEPIKSRGEHARSKMLEVVKQTATELIRLHEDLYLEDYPRYDVLGLSMGGLLAYYLTTITSSIDYVVALISTPNFQTIDFKNETTDSESKMTIERLIKDMDPAQHIAQMRFKKIMAFSGKNDTVIPYHHTDDFIQQHPKLPMIHETFDTDHSLNPKMAERVVYHLKNTS